jgi:Pentapeptide repeats (8 copies)
LRSHPTELEFSRITADTLMIEGYLLYKGPDGVKEWNRRRKAGEPAPRLSHLDLHNADLHNAHLGGIDLQGANLSGANLVGANLSDAVLHGARLPHANLGRAYLHGARFGGLFGADLGRARLIQADLRRADLYRVILSGATLRDADLSGADLRGSRLDGADLSRAKLRALIENAESFLNESLAKAILAKEDPREWKFAILALVQALELTLKEMLRREHWTLVFQSVDKPTMTVSFEGALSRLTNIVKVPFAADDIATARTAIALRNQVTHSDVHFEEQQVKVVFTRLLGFAQHCFAIYFGKPLQEVVSRPVWDAGKEKGSDPIVFGTIFDMIHMSDFNGDQTLTKVFLSPEVTARQRTLLVGWLDRSSHTLMLEVIGVFQDTF